MEKKRDYCFRHSKMYEGWQCPMCLDEEERGTGPSTAQTAAPPRAQAQAASLAVPKPAAAPSKAESQAKSTQAEAMLLSGAPREALDLCEAAIELDRRNLAAYLVGARASRVLRDATSEQEFLETAIKLLHSEEYGKTSRWYIDVLKHVRDGRMVTQLVKAFVSARRWPAAEALAMVKTLVGRGATSDALVVLDSLPSESRSLLTCAYSLQLAGLARPGVDPDLLRYLVSVSAAERAKVLAEFYEVKGAEVLAGMTVSKVRDAVRARYAEWATEIKHLLSEEARKVAAERIAPQLNAPASSGAVKFLLAGLVVAIVLGIVGGAVGFVVGAVVAVGLAGAGYAYGRDVELKKLVPAILPDVKEELTNREAERWDPVLAEDPIEPIDTEAEAAAAPVETCPFCGASIPADVASCPQCQRPLAQEQAPAEAPEAPAETAQPAAEVPASEPGPAGEGGST